MITYPLNNIDYSAEDAELFHCTRTSGIWAKDSFSISVTGADNNATIGTGIAWINNEKFSGKVTALKTAKVLDLGIADGAYPRIDVIAIQYNANNNGTDIIVKKGTPATNPIRPAMVRTGAIYELYLASVYRPAGSTAVVASNITDSRMDETVCGLMADSITKVDMESINLQFKEIVARLEEEIQNISVGELVPIIKGGTGAKNPSEALKNLGGVEMALIWKNASPTNAFPLQTLNIDISKYNYIGMICNHAITYPKRMMPLAICPNIVGFQAAATAPDMMRTMQIVSDNSVEIGGASNGIQTNLVPCYIYGLNIKEVQ